VTLAATRPADAAVAPAPTPAGGRPRLRIWATIVSFLLPAVVLFSSLVLIPIGVALYLSLFKWGGFGVPSDFVGLGNFTQLFRDDVFLGDLWRGFLLIAFSLGIQLPFSLSMAVLLNQKLRGRAVYRLLFFAPYVLSEVITGVLFSMIFQPGSGPADHLLKLVGLQSLGGKWFADSSTVLVTIFVVITWKYFGFHMMLYLAGLQGIPSEVLEAASIDGAGAWQRFRHVTLPLLGPTIRISIFLSIIGAIQLFDLIWVITNGGPTHSSETMAITMFQFGFKRYEVGYASAISVVILGISLIFALFYQRYVMRRDLEGAVTNMRAKR
jgi:raffinose/stachyose/melibiose transport system permease protein